MSGKHFLTTAILLAFSITMISCGDAGKSSAADVPAPIYPNSAQQNRHKSTSSDAINARFTPRSQGLVEGSALRLSETSRGSRYISNGYSVHPFSSKQQAKIQSMLNETNRYRKQHGIAPLKYDLRLSAYAYVRADEIRNKYAHTRPNGTEFFSGLTIGNGWKGENLDASRESVDETFSAWINSPAHKNNLLNQKFERIGIAYVYDPNSRLKYHWAQIFASDDLSTPYHFDPQMAGTVTTPDMESYLNRKISLQNGRISLIGGQKSTANNASLARQNGQLSHSIYNRARHYADNHYQAIIQEPAGVFSYQTFGEVVDTNREPVQYLNIGQPTIPDVNTHFQATYRGASVGNLNKQSHVYADVTADVNFGQTKTMNLRFQNSKISRGDIVNHNPNTGLNAVNELNFAEQLHWNSRQGRFTGYTTSANFYGPTGEEIGGQFARQINGDVYQGAFGLRKVN